MSRKVSLAFIVIVISSIFVNCDKEARDWKKTVKLNDITSVETFLSDYPDSKYSEKADSLLVNLYWQKAQQENTISSYTAFIEKYPNTPHFDEANSNVEKLFWDQAKSLNTIDQYDEFLFRYPSSEYRETAKENKSKLLLASEKATDTIDLKKSNVREAVSGFKYTGIWGGQAHIDPVFKKVKSREGYEFYRICSKIYCKKYFRLPLSDIILTDDFDNKYIAIDYYAELENGNKQYLLSDTDMIPIENGMTVVATFEVPQNYNGKYKFQLSSFPVKTIW